MASAIGTALISTILQPMAAKAMHIIRDKVVDKVDGIANIEGDISSLQTTLRMIQDIVHVAEEKQIDKKVKKNDDDFIRNWLRDLVDIAYEARDVLDEFITFSSCINTAEEAKKPVNTISSLMLSCFCGLSRDTSKLPLAVLNRLAKDIRSVRERFDEKKNEGETFRNLRSVVVGGGSESVCVDRRPIVGPSTNKQGDNLFLGREEVKERIMKKLLHPIDDNRVHVVAIWGMGGIGKTTLAQSIYNDERIKEDDYPTENRGWLCVGENKFSAEKVIKEIVNDQNTTGIGNLQTKLKEKLRGVKQQTVRRFLIVLDDVWDVDGSEWDKLFNPLTEVGKGGLIIITKREKEVCPKLIKIQTAYNLDLLSEQNSWLIFESCAYKDGKSDSTPYLKDIGKEIVKKLNGLPLALRVVGCSLLEKDSNTWTNFLESNEWKLTNDDEVMPSLRWSYNHLPRHLKTCFTYCALFPKDHVLDKKVLVEMWMAHDLIQKEEEKRPEDVGSDYFEELVNASLLQCVDRKHVMHDLIHDLALLVSNGEFSSAVGSLSTDQMKKVRHITITDDDENSNNLSLCKSKRILTVYTPYKRYWHERSIFKKDILLEVFKQSKNLRVLVLCNKDIVEIPDCISELRHLRYLDVSQTFVGRLPDSLCRLYNLQMIAAPIFTDLPRDIVNMVNLRYVRAYLCTCKGVGKLTSLQELSIIHVWEDDDLRELGDMQILRGKLIINGLGNVKKLDDDVGAFMDEQTLIDELILGANTSAKALDAIGCPPNLTYLEIEHYTSLELPKWMVDGKLKFAKLQTLKITCAPNVESLPPFGELTSLKYLYLMRVGVERLGDEFYGKFTDGKVFFPSLESLYFDEMEEWEEWDDIITGYLGMSFFPHLTKLVISRCPKLVSVLPVVKNPIMNAANFMTSLSTLKIRNCDGLRSLPADGFPPSLTYLKIVGCLLLYERCKDESSPDRHKIDHIPKKYIRI